MTAPVPVPAIDRTDVPSRSHGELALYMAQHPCPRCGDADTTTLARAEVGAQTHYRGPCRGCGAEREFRFQRPPAVLAPKNQRPTKRSGSSNQ